MSDEKKLILFDIDHTLFNTSLYLENCFISLAHKLHRSDRESFTTEAMKIYQQHRQSGPFRQRQFLAEMLGNENHMKLEELETIFLDPQIMKASLYPDGETTLRTLQERNHQIGIFSYGLDTFQQSKIDSLKGLLTQDFIYITEIDKVESVSEIVEKHLSDTLYVVDDLPEVLNAFKRKNKQVITMLIDREGAYTAYQGNELDDIDYTLANLQEMLTIIQ